MSAGGKNLKLDGEHSRDAARHMDGIYRYQRYIYDLTRKYFLLGRDTLIDGLRPTDGGRVLEVGCGTGRNLILAARRYPHAQFYGFDISEMMLETARANTSRAGLADRIEVAQGDAADFNTEAMFGVDGFDRVFVSYSLSMIPPWREATRAALAAVRPGGELHIVDFGQQEKLPRLFKTGLHAWLAKFSVEPRPDLEAELHRLASEPRYEVQFDRILRDYSHYAVVKVAKHSAESNSTDARKSG
ncbi:MAG: class I SAM-dependent methyltransferase [Alphaproteobacteria bacterium]|nr:class I SAM-dependent methyltransferase [Alphaproteobacteria bacterium]